MTTLLVVCLVAALAAAIWAGWSNLRRHRRYHEVYMARQAGRSLRRKTSFG